MKSRLASAKYSYILSQTKHMLKIRGFVQPTQIAMNKAHIYLGGLGLDAMLRFRTSSLQLAVYL